MLSSVSIGGPSPLMASRGTTMLDAHSRRVDADLAGRN
jgi:hypothetical protein